MKYNPNEKYANWVEQVKEHELELAKLQLKKAQDIDLVLESMSSRITEKLLHPLFKKIEQEYAQQSKSESDQYQQNYLSKIPPRADHMED